MGTQQAKLVALRGFSNLVLLGSPFVPALPLVATGPARHDEDAVPIGHIVELAGLKFAFETNGVQAHVADVTKFGFNVGRRVAQQHITGPSSSANHDGLSVDHEE